MWKLKSAAWCASAAILCAAHGVAAQPAPVVQHSETVAAPPPVKNLVSASLTAGATVNTGNTKSYGANVGGRFGLVRKVHQLTLEMLATMAWARADANSDVEATAKNVFGRARYDFFLSNDDALFIAIQPRRDTFAGIDLRLQNQVGYLRNLYKPSDALRIWSELGYDLTYDNFSEITTTTTTDVTADFPNLDDNLTVTETETVTLQPQADLVHSARIFLGYTNTLNPLLTVNLGAETLLDFADGKNVRVNGVAELTSSLSDNFKLGIQSRVLFDNVPVPGKEKVDAIIAAQLVYTFETSSKAAEEPAPCDCAEAVAEAKAACTPCEEAAGEAADSAAGESPAEEAPADGAAADSDGN